MGVHHLFAGRRVHVARVKAAEIAGADAQPAMARVVGVRNHGPGRLPVSQAFAHGLACQLKPTMPPGALPQDHPQDHQPDQERGEHEAARTARNPREEDAGTHQQAAQDGAATFRQRQTEGGQQETAKNQPRSPGPTEAPGADEPRPQGAGQQ